jgi:SAM-dependent methyltransferase
MEDHTQIVRDGYNIIGPGYHARRLTKQEMYDRWLDGLRPLLPLTGKVVDLGCGGGVPIARYFASRGYDVTGYDLSEKMIGIAQREVPEGKFVLARIEDLQLEEASVDLITSFFAIIHIPRHRHALLFRRMWDWLRPGGAALLSLGANDNPEEFQSNWRGAPMKWSHFDAEANLALLSQAGFEIAWSDIEEYAPGERHLFVVAHRP